MRPPAAFSGLRNGTQTTAASLGRSALVQPRPVDGDRVYTLGRTGVLSAISVDTGMLLWRKDYAADYAVDRMTWGFDWGFASAPLVDGERLICFVGGSQDARVVAFDKIHRRGDLASPFRARRTLASPSRSLSKRAGLGSSSSGIPRRSRRSTRSPATSTGSSPTQSGVR